MRQIASSAVFIFSSNAALQMQNPPP